MLSPRLIPLYLLLQSLSELRIGDNFNLKSKMRLLLSAVAAILLLGTFDLAEAARSSALEARRLSDHPVMRSARRTFVDELADYLNTWAFHSIDRQARSHFTEIFGVNSNDAMKASTLL